MLLRDKILILINCGVRQNEIAKRANLSAMSITNYLWKPGSISKSTEERIATAVDSIVTEIERIRTNDNEN